VQHSRIRNTFSFAELVALADVVELRARKWVDRHLVSFDADLQREGDKHRRFSVTDIYRAALVNQLNDFGYDAEEASEAIENIFRQVCEEHKIRYSPPEKRETEKLIHALRGTTVFIRFGRQRVASWPRADKEEEITRTRNYHIVYEKGLKKIHPANEGALLTLFVGGIINDVDERLAQIHKGED